jgi:hypothetical protein
MRMRMRMRMRWWRRRRAAPGTGRDQQGRVYDGDRVRPDGLPSWHDLLPARAALNEPTQILDRPLMTRGQRYRANGGRR